MYGNQHATKLYTSEQNNLVCKDYIHSVPRRTSHTSRPNPAQASPAEKTSLLRSTFFQIFEDIRTPKVRQRSRVYCTQHSWNEEQTRPLRLMQYRDFGTDNRQLKCYTLMVLDRRRRWILTNFSSFQILDFYLKNDQKVYLGIFVCRRRPLWDSTTYLPEYWPVFLFLFEDCTMTTIACGQTDNLRKKRIVPKPWKTATTANIGLFFVKGSSFVFRFTN